MWVELRQEEVIWRGASWPIWGPCIRPFLHLPVIGWGDERRCQALKSYFAIRKEDPQAHYFETSCSKMHLVLSSSSNCVV